MGRNRSRRKNKKRGTRRLKHRGGSNGTVVFILNHGGGFASVFNFLCKAYIYAKETGRNFLIDDEGEWPYRFKDGWHDYFKSLKSYDRAQTYPNMIKLSHTSARVIPDWSPVSKYTLAQYTKAAKEILVLNDDLEAQVQEYIKKIGGTYKSIYIRRGDKTSGPAKENEAINLAEMLKTTDISPTDKVFVQTDDYSVIEEIKGILPPENIYTMTPPESRGAVAGNISGLSPENRKKHAEELFTSFMVFVRASRGWTDNRSNLGRLHKIYAPGTIVLYPAEPNNQDIPASTVIDPAWGGLHA